MTFWNWLTAFLSRSTFKISFPEVCMDIEPLQNAFKNSKYRWRTIRGIAKETHLSEEVIKAYILLHRDRIIKAKRKNVNGEDLYTTRELFRKHATLAERVIAAFKSRIDLDA